MKIDEFVRKANRNSEIGADDNDGVISIFADTGDSLIDVPVDATNFLEVNWYNVKPVNYFSKHTREYLSALIDEFLQTPIDERYPEKKYRLVANPNSLEETGTYASKYVACIDDSMDSFSFVYGGPTIFSEKDLKQIEELHPNIAPAIETMKEPVEDK